MARLDKSQKARSRGSGMASSSLRGHPPAGHTSLDNLLGELKPEVAPVHAARVKTGDKLGF